MTQVNKTTPTTFPLSLDGRGIKGEGDNDATHRHNPENPLNPENPDSKQLPMKRGDAAPYLSMLVPSPCGYCLKASMTAWRLICLVSSSPLIPLPSRERGILSVVLACVGGNDGVGAGGAVIFEGY